MFSFPPGVSSAGTLPGPTHFLIMQAGVAWMIGSRSSLASSALFRRQVSSRSCPSPETALRFQGISFPHRPCCGRQEKAPDRSSTLSTLQMHRLMAVAPTHIFVEYYKMGARDLVGLRGLEHTAQVSYEDRVDRETRFRKGDLPVLFCSPTMELGVDISDLNVVNMRNMPPTPANYAQRSGRAGRSGQPALVYSYCTTGSSHDQYFFRRPTWMVAGAVTPPRLDLAN
jgi:hypothetical protein